MKKSFPRIIFSVSFSFILDFLLSDSLFKKKKKFFLSSSFFLFYLSFSLFVKKWEIFLLIEILFVFLNSLFSLVISFFVRNKKQFSKKKSTWRHHTQRASSERFIELVFRLANQRRAFGFWRGAMTHSLICLSSFRIEQHTLCTHRHRERENESFCIFSSLFRENTKNEKKHTLEELDKEWRPWRTKSI